MSNGPPTPKSSVGSIGSGGSWAVLSGVSAAAGVVGNGQTPPRRSGCAPGAQCHQDAGAPGRAALTRSVPSGRIETRPSGATTGNPARSATRWAGRGASVGALTGAWAGASPGS
ncbi:hypothetical protein [Kitasatospora mediocidica]|uniref:hypothetical protein n=1 Tax=Kitasatospora mediocidica TaxID=58352 RepID=UPI0018DDE4D0|nr:hypothetical protein [Kitasatospora mediocidica]